MMMEAQTVHPGSSALPAVIHIEKSDGQTGGWLRDDLPAHRRVDHPGHSNLGTEQKRG
jgi:hypothetical protein